MGPGSSMIRPPDTCSQEAELIKDSRIALNPATVKTKASGWHGCLHAFKAFASCPSTPQLLEVMT